MKLKEYILESEEKAIFAMRNLFRSYGYTKYKMSKFEEYDLYARNKDFLVSDNIITFNDGDGKLMALKPDVTLSIVKNTKNVEDSLKKVYYNENVYRVSGDTKDFKELMQVGLECIGELDDYCICEAVLLAAKSLECISDDFVLDISHMGIISSALDFAKLSNEGKKSYLKALGEKNLGSVLDICEREDVGEKAKKLLSSLVRVYGEPKAVLESISCEAVGEEFQKAVNQLDEITGVLENLGYKGKTRIDFSVANNMNYYSGIAFKGFINGIPGGILSGGQYDRLMEKFGKPLGAIGFAVYLDMLDILKTESEPYDVDTLLLYDEGESLSTVSQLIDTFSKNGESVRATKSIPKKLKYRRILKIKNGEATEIE